MPSKTNKPTEKKLTIDQQRAIKYKNKMYEAREELEEVKAALKAARDDNAELRELIAALTSHPPHSPHPPHRCAEPEFDGNATSEDEDEDTRAGARRSASRRKPRQEHQAQHAHHAQYAHQPRFAASAEAEAEAAEASVPPCARYQRYNPEQQPAPARARGTAQDYTNQSASPGKKRGICRHYNSPQGCSRGDDCHFQHVPYPSNGGNHRGAKTTGSKRGKPHNHSGQSKKPGGGGPKRGASGNTGGQNGGRRRNGRHSQARD